MKILVIFKHGFYDVDQEIEYEMTSSKMFIIDELCELEAAFDYYCHCNWKFWGEPNGRPVMISYIIQNKNKFMQ